MLFITVNNAVLFCIEASLVLALYWLVTHAKKKPIKQLILFTDGRVIVDGGEQQLIGGNSRLGWNGLWLELLPLQEMPSKKNNRITRLFFFKDQLSSTDYCRLSRYVLKINSYTQTESELK